MPYTIKTGYFNFKDENGQYVRSNTIAEQSTAEQIAEIEAVGAAQKAAITETEMLTVAYTAGPRAENNDSSIARITIDIPKDADDRKIRYEMGHCVDTEIHSGDPESDVNADVWRLMYIYYVLANGNATMMTLKGEYECALRMVGHQDFSGGIVHGDEKDVSVTFLVDGKPKAAANVGGFCNEFRVIRKSLLYEPPRTNDPQIDTHQNVIAEHGCEYIYDKTGLTINQSVKWLVAENLYACYLAMFPIAKSFSAYRYDNTSFDVVENPVSSSISVEIPNATSVTQFNDTVTSTMAIPKYPTGLTGGDKANITDGSGRRDYNKVYFYACGGGASNVGELWMSTTKYSIK